MCALESTDWSKASGLERLVGKEVLDDPRVIAALEEANQAAIKFHAVLNMVAAEKRLIQNYTRTDDLLVRKNNAL